MMFVASDLEGTLSRAETWRVVGRFLERAGRGAAYRRLVAVGALRSLGSRFGLVHSAGLRERWFEEMTALLRGFDTAQVDALMSEIVESLWQARRTVVIAELERYRREGMCVVIVSGSYIQVVRGFAERLGAQALGSVLEVDEAGRLTGKLVGEVVSGEAKVRKLRALIGDAPLIAAYGDTEGDAPMLRMSRQPVAVSPNRTLRRIAQAEGWRMLEDAPAR